jgi:hypothetical protein
MPLQVKIEKRVAESTFVQTLCFERGLLPLWVKIKISLVVYQGVLPKPPRQTVRTVWRGLAASERSPKNVFT